MNRDRIQGFLRLIVGRLEEVWGRLIHDEGIVLAGLHRQTLGRVQTLYGRARTEAERRLAAWERDVRAALLDPHPDARRRHRALRG